MGNLWTPNDDMTPEEKKAFEDATIKQRQEAYLIEPLPSEIEKLNAILQEVYKKIEGHQWTDKLRTKVKEEILNRAAIEAGLVVEVEFKKVGMGGEGEVYESPEVSIVKRVEFDIDEQAKLLFELKRRGGYKGDFDIGN